MDQLGTGSMGTGSMDSTDQMDTEPGWANTGITEQAATGQTDLGQQVATVTTDRAYKLETDMATILTEMLQILLFVVAV